MIVLLCALILVAHSQLLFSARASLQECAGLLAWNGEHLGFYGVQLSRNSLRHKLSVSTCVST